MGGGLAACQRRAVCNQAQRALLYDLFRQHLQESFLWHRLCATADKPEGRVLMMDRIEWKDGWPSVEGNSPSTESHKPVFTQR